MRVLVRIVALGCAVGLMALPLVNVTAEVQAAPITVPATVSASNWMEVPSTAESTTTNNYGFAVSCATSVFCLQAGFLETAGGEVPLVWTWNGTSWAPIPTPNAAGATEAELDGVSCVSASWCMLVGDATVGGVEHPLVETWDGSQLSLASGPGSPPSRSNFGGVSCASASFCVAAGSAYPAANQQVYLGQWNGSTWTTEVEPNAPGTFGSYTDGVSCGTASACMAVGGTDTDNSGTTETDLAYLWNGSSWTYTNPGNGGNDDNSLASVSCAGSSFCAAAGFSEVDFAGASTSLVTMWNGTSWTVANTPNTPTGGGNYLYGISCFSATTCSAVGSNFTDSSQTTYVSGALTWNGQTWNLVNSPNPGAAPFYVSFLGVDCLSGWACMTVGSDSATGGGDYLPFNAQAPIARSGYRFVASDGGIFAYPTGTGSPAPFLGSMGGTPLNAPIVGMAVMPGGDGYYLVASDGGVFSFGSAQFYGSMGGMHLNKPIVGIAVTADGAGYWLVASDGGVFSFGDASFYGSTGALHLNKPVVGMAPVPNGRGYYLVASDGGIFAFPSSGPTATPFFGSTGNLVLNKPIVGMAMTPGGGYYLVASDGGIFSFPANGVAAPTFLGSMGGTPLNKPVVGMAVIPKGYFTFEPGGYYLVAADGGVFSFPTAPAPNPLPFFGSTGNIVLNKPIVGMAS